MLGSAAQRLLSKVLEVIQETTPRSETTTMKPSKGTRERGEIQMAGKEINSEGRWAKATDSQGSLERLPGATWRSTVTILFSRTPKL